VVKDVLDYMASLMLLMSISIILGHAPALH